MINIVCVNNGGKYVDEYTSRLYAMIARELHQPFTFNCFTDRPRALRPEIIQHDISDWKLPGWFAKLRLFDGGSVPFESFLYLDLTLIVKSSLDSLIDYAKDKHFVAQQDWHYDCFNSSVMWITKHPMNQRVWDNYAGGRIYSTRHHGDQDYIHAVYKDDCRLDNISYFPDGWVLSFKDIRRLHARSPEDAKQLVKNAIILKFHGHPKPHELLMPKNEFLKLRLTNLNLLFKDWYFMDKDIREWWLEADG